MGLTSLLPFTPMALAADDPAQQKIDRRALIDRHKIVLSKADPLDCLTVGNGEFGFTADVTGLQTFPGFHESGIQLQTMAQWAWHTTPSEHEYKLSDTFNLYQAGDRKVPYPSGDEEGGGFGDGSPAAYWLNANPHKFDLGRLSLVLPEVDGRAAKVEDVKEIHQELDLWNGRLTSHFTFAGQPVVVETVAHPSLDAVAVKVTSPLVHAGSLGVRLAFSYAPPDWKNPADWGEPDRHTTTLNMAGGECVFDRQIDHVTSYFARAAVSDKADRKQVGTHEFVWSRAGEPSLELVLSFSPKPGSGTFANFNKVRDASARHWMRFWSTGGAVDLSESKDERWKELERRIVLSQYQTAVNSTGTLPPQETGLVQNSWFGKFHLEMHWWHAAHFALWGRSDLLRRSLGFYRNILPVARETAARIGCKGARWPKMVGPDGRESPNRINPFLTWQQPHPIHFAELIYQAKPTHETLEFLKDIVLESAEFMASFPLWNEARGCFELGPPSVAPYENNYIHRKTSKNPTFDLAYWRWAMGVAQDWRERLGMERSAEWEHVRSHLAPLTVKEGIYRETEEVDTGFSGHPTMVGTLGIVPNTGLVDKATMQETLDFVMTKWPRDDTWGWDYPMMAMAAARLDRPDLAIDALFLDASKNRYLANGHNYQQAILPLYLPGNGGLLFAVAMMAAGWKGAPKGHAPGFPEGWTVRWEGLLPGL